MEGGQGHKTQVVVSKRMAQIQSGMALGRGALTMSAAMRMVHEERLAERESNLLRDRGDDPTFFNLSRLTVEELTRSTMESVLELWGIESMGGTPLTAEVKTEGGEGTKANKSTGDQTEFSMELGGDSFAMLGHACEKFGTCVFHVSVCEPELLSWAACANSNPLTPKRNPHPFHSGGPGTAVAREGAAEAVARD